MCEAVAVSRDAQRWSHGQLFTSRRHGPVPGRAAQRSEETLGAHSA